jgi:uncharacterized protein (DUF488 family)
VRTLVDVRRNNTSQLAGFAKSADLAFFLRELGGIAYRHAPELAPDEADLVAYRRRDMTWEAYRERFLASLAARGVEKLFVSHDLAGACLLCSEAKPEKCHRRLVCEYLNSAWEQPAPVQHL